MLSIAADSTQALDDLGHTHTRDELLYRSHSASMGRYGFQRSTKMKIYRSLILSCLLSSSFAVGISIDNRSTCELVKIGSGQMPEVRNHQSTDKISAHGRGDIQANLSHYQGNNIDGEAFFDLYMASCRGTESVLVIGGDAESWVAELSDDSPLHIQGENYPGDFGYEEKTGAYGDSLVLLDSKR